MKKILKKLTLATILFAGVLSVAVPADAKDLSLRMASQMPHDSPEGRVHAYFAEMVNKYSNGTIKVVIYPNDQLGTVGAAMEQLKLGTIHIYAEGANFMQKWVPEMSWTGAPYLFESREHWVRFMNSPLVQAWFKEAQDKAGISSIGDPTSILRGPYRVMVSTKKVNGLDDLQGLKLRLHSNKTQVAAWTYMGTSVNVLPWTEIYSSLQTGIVEAANCPVAQIESMRFYEVAPYIARTDEYFQSVMLMTNRSMWNSFDESQKEILIKAQKAAAIYSEKVINAAAEATVATVQKQGAEYIKLDPVPFVKKMEQFYQEQSEQGNLPKGFLETVSATR